MGRVGKDRQRPAVPDDPEEIEILEIEGMAESEAPPARDEIEILFDERPEPSRAPAVQETPEDAASRDRLLRLKADFDNLRKRIEREQEEFRNVATSRLVTALLPVLDNLERAIASAGSEGGEASLRVGVELIHRQLLDVLRKEGLRPVDAVGQPFDPMIHEAVATDETPGYPPNTVIEEVQRGFFIHDRLLRPALVKVSLNANAGAEDDGSREGR
jgi:molecular chaperone GrpE